MPISSTVRTSALAVGVLAVAAVAFLATRPSPPPPCPEPVTLDDRGDPRNAAGKIRNCWRGQAKCQCDRDGDCYRLPGHVACTAVTTPAPVRDAGVVARDVPVTRDAGPARVDAGSLPAPVDAGPPITLPPTSGLRAFPGAEGFGASATGGRGGRVVFVTTLATSGPGSLADALAQTGARTVIFRVSGVIRTEAHLLSGNVTIAGQTSPGGITVQGIDTTEAQFCDQSCGATARGVENFVIRFVRSRPAGGSFPDGLRLRYARNGIIDHVSIGNAADEAVEISYANNLTLQDTLLAETVGGHANYGGMLVNYTNPAAGYQLDNLTLARCAWVRIMGRYPEMSRESAGVAAGTTLRADLVNNLIWDQRYFANFEATDVSGDDQGRAIHYQVNRVGNYSFAGPSFRFGQVWMRVKAAGTGAFFADNRVNLWPNLADWQLNYCCNDFSAANAGARPSWARSTRYDFPAVAVMPSTSVASYAVAHCGAFPRDPMDRRLWSHVAAGTIDPAPIDRNPAGDALQTAFAGAAPAPPPDGDLDGMDDAWERANGLNPTIADHNGTQLSQALTGVAGYTNLECYLHQLALQRVQGR